MTEPLCDCHGEPKIQYADGYWRCRVNRRKSVRRHEDRDFVYRAKKALYDRRYHAQSRRATRVSDQEVTLGEVSPQERG